MINSLSRSSHFKQIYAQKFPAPAISRKNIERGARLFFAQLFRFHGNIGNEQVAIQLFGAQDPGPPILRLSADHARDESL